MKTINGTQVAAGIAIGPIFKLEKEEIEIPEYKVVNSDEELARLYKAIAMSKVEIQTKKDSLDISKVEKDILESHLAMLDDPELIDLTKSHITHRKTNAERALKIACEHFICLLVDTGDDYLKGRANDISDITDRVLKFLLNKTDNQYLKLEKPSIVVAEELTVNDIAGLGNKLVLGFITSKGGITDHAAIMANSYGIPMVTGISSSIFDIRKEAYVILDGNEGKVILNPDKHISDQVKEKIKVELAFKKNAELKSKEIALTKDGHPVKVYANIGTVENAENAIKNGAGGIGLFRTELLFIDNNELLDEETQFKYYSEIANIFTNKEIVIRTLDIGGDKQIRSLKLKDEENPALGLRALRLMFENEEEMLIPQLKAILRLTSESNIKLLLPMVSAIDEVRRVKTVLKTCRDELKSNNIPVAENIDIGIMIEVPSSAILSEIFAKEVDFFSIGTNDLTQYTLSADRTNPDVSYLNQGLQPAVLHLISKVVKSAHAQKKPVGVCGELASNKYVIPILIGLGVDELSVNPIAIPTVKEIIRKISKSVASEIAKEALTKDNWQDIKQLSEMMIGRNI